MIYKRYIFRELVGPFLLGLVTFTGIMLTGKFMKTVELLLSRSAGPAYVVKLVFYIAPFFIGFTVPMGFLLAVLVAFGRLSSNRELMAMKGSGMSPYQIYAPVAIFSIFAFFISLFSLAYVLPWSATGYRNTIIAIAKARTDLGIREKVFNREVNGVMIYVNKIDRSSGKLKGVLISDGRNLDEPATIVAKEGSISVDGAKGIIRMDLYNGSIHRAGRNLKSVQTLQFDHYLLRIDWTTGIYRGIRSRKTFREMYPLELLKALKEGRIKKKYVPIAMVELHSKLAVPFACVIFGLLGIPVGSMFGYAGRYHGFAIGVIIISLYYGLMMLGQALVKMGGLPPFAGAWLPDFVLGTLAVVVFMFTAKESALPFFLTFGRFYRAVQP